MDADPMTKADPIPLPSETDINIDLVGIWLSARAHHDYSNAYYTENIKFYRDIEALCRRCHAAESEVARLRDTPMNAEPLTEDQVAELRAGLHQIVPGSGGDWYVTDAAETLRELATPLLAAAEEVARLRAEVERLSEENSECRTFASTADQMVKDAEQRIATLTAERDSLSARLAEAERLLQDIRPVLQTGAWGDMIAAFLARTTPQEK